MSRPARALWIEIFMSAVYGAADCASRPARALWIEISGTMQAPSLISVEAREGLVD